MLHFKCVKVHDRRGNYEFWNVNYEFLNGIFESNYEFWNGTNLYYVRWYVYYIIVYICCGFKPFNYS